MTTSPRPLHLSATFLVLFALAACATTPDTIASPGSPEHPALRLEALATPALAVSREVGSLGVLVGSAVDSSDGPRRQLAVKVLRVDVQVVGRLARTEVTQVFTNQTGARLEGVYAFTLPEDATISRLAMDVEGEMTEGELVERERARTIYQGIVRQRRDPALLEWQGGQRFQMRIFPIEPQSSKTVVVAYEQVLPELDGQVHYRYALPELPATSGQDARIHAFQFTVTSELDRHPAVYGYAWAEPAPGRVEVARTDFLPAGPVDVRFERDAQASTKIGYGTWRGERFFAVELTPRLPARAVREAPALVLLIDTSASMGQPEVERIAEVAKGLAASQGGVVAVVAEGAPCASAFAPAAEAASCLTGLKSAGATDLGALLQAGATLATSRPGEVAVILFSDGTPTSGEVRGEALVWLSRMGPKVALHTVAVGADPDLSRLAAMARAGGGHTLRMNPVVPPAEVQHMLARSIADPVVSNVVARLVDGAAAGLTPWQPINLAYGESVVVLGRLDADASTVAVEGRYAGQPFSELVTVAWPAAAPDGSILGHFWARATLDAMQQGGAERSDVVEVSRRYGVMSPYTSFLVLEGQAAYDRLAVERRKQAELDALLVPPTDQASAAPISTAGLTPAPLDLGAPVPPTPFGATEPMVDLGAASGNASDRGVKGGATPTGHAGFGTGGIGTGAGGIGGYGGNIGDYGIGGPGKRQTSPPRISVGMPQVQGSLDKQLIRRIIRRHTSELRYCYERALQRQPNIQGKLVVKFVVDPTGNVVKAEVQTSTLKSREVETCVTTRMRRWRFPAPEGVLFISYPFIFQTDGVYGGMSTLQSLELSHKSGNMTWDEGVQLMELYLANDDTAKGLALYRELAGKMTAAQGAWAPLELAWAVRGAAPSALLRQARRVFPAGRSGGLSAADGLPSYLVEGIVEALPERRRWKEASALFATAPFQPAAAGWLLDRLVVNGAEAEARTLVEGWLAHGPLTAEDAFVAFTSNAKSATTFSELVWQATSTLAANADNRPQVWANLASSSLTTGHGDEAVALALRRCNATRGDLVCYDTLRALSRLPGAREVFLSYALAELDELVRQRRDDAANLQLIDRQVALLDDLGDPASARRALMEAVEFAPQDTTMRLEIARRLVARHEQRAACDLIVAARQLDPSLTVPLASIFRETGAPAEELGAGLYQCVVDLNARASIERDLVVLVIPRTEQGWVNAEVVEPSGVTVRASVDAAASGATLTADPSPFGLLSTYTLTSAPAGTWAVVLRRSSGAPTMVEVDVVVIRDAGGPSPTVETRTVRVSNGAPVEVPVKR